MSVNIVSQFQSFIFGHNYPTLQRGFSAIAELLVILVTFYVVFNVLKFYFERFYIYADGDDDDDNCI